MSLSAAGPRAPDISGRALDGRYELHRLLGEGTFGRVYRGVDRRLARAVAVKVIKPWWAEDPEWVRRFEREAQLMASVTDPGIVQIFDVGQAPEGLYYVAELVAGESVDARLRRGPLEVEEARGVAEQLARALGSAHAARIVHGDVKPANVLISARGQVKVTDFGLARLLGSGGAQLSSTIAGTPAYMAPEQARGRATQASDVYSAGVVLYELLSGHPPFEGDAPVEVALRHLQDTPPPLPAHVPAGLAGVVNRALAKEPADRYRDGTELAAALARAGEGSRGPARPARGRGAARPGPTSRGLVRTLVAPVWSPRRNVDPGARRCTGVAFAAVLAVVAGLVGAALLAGRSRGGPPPVPVPSVTGFSSPDAQSTLRQRGLRPRIQPVPGLGASPGSVTAENPPARHRLRPGSTVTLSVAEAPRWRAVLGFSSQSGHSTESFRIRGSRWRLRYRMDYVGTCTFLFICSGPTAHVTGPAGDAAQSFDLNSGAGQTQTFRSGPGSYRVNITPGQDTARWSVEVQDYY